jgi:hypothetical protein
MYEDCYFINYLKSGGPMYLTNIGFDSRATLSANSSIISLFIYLTIRWIGQIQLCNRENYR